jgi:predicted MFS family arabinose efflux permease
MGVMRFGMPLAPVLAGMCATLLGIGLQRFAYAPLLPAMVQEGWLSPGAAGALGAANLAGYLAGALAAGWIVHRTGLGPALRVAMLIVTVCFALCAFSGGLLWFLPWRVGAGAAGAVLMVLAGPAVQLAVPLQRRGLAAGIMFTGVGAGIVTGAVLVPALLPLGLPATWLALAGTGVLLTAFSWRRWPDAALPPLPRDGAAPPARGGGRLILAYALAAVAATPHMLWWPDFIARGLQRGTASGAYYWLAFGIAAACGPALCGRLADRLGAVKGLTIVLGIQAISVGLPLVATGAAALLLSSALAGASTIGTTALALTRAKEIAGDGAPRLWRISTAGYGGAQSAAGFAMAWLYAATGSHLPLFAAGLVAALGALVLARG